MDERDIIGSVADAVLDALHVPVFRGDLDGDPVAEDDPLGEPDETTVNVKDNDVVGEFVSDN